MGRRLSKHLVHNGAPLRAFIDIDPAKIGRMRRGVPIMSPAELPALWASWQRPALVTAVGSRGARELIRAQLQAMGLVEGEQWWAAA